MVRSNEEWKYWGKSDPLYGVLSSRGRDKDGSNPWSKGDFLEHGKSDFRDILAHWRQYGIGSNRCIEIGCGSGRMTNQLLEQFKTVFAVDVSVDQVARARDLLGPKASSVDFVVINSPELPTEASSCDGMFSSLVFQHIVPYNAVEQYLELTFEKLIPGASACFQIPIVGAHGIGIRRFGLILLRHLRVTVERKFGSARSWEYQAYLANRLFSTLAKIGYEAVELRMFSVGRPDEIQSFFFARKPEELSDSTV